MIAPPLDTRAPAEGPALPRHPPTGSRRPSRVRRAMRERAIEAPLLAAALVSILTTAGIIGVLVFETIEFFQEVPLRQFLTETQWTPLFIDKHFGIVVLFSATLLTSVGAMLVALPLGLLAAVYLSEYASPGVHSVV